MASSSTDGPFPKPPFIKPKEVFGGFHAFFNLTKIFPGITHKRLKVYNKVYKLLSIVVKHASNNTLPTTLKCEKVDSQSHLVTTSDRVVASTFRDLFGTHVLREYIQNGKHVCARTVMDVAVLGSIKAMRVLFVAICQLMQKKPDVELIFCALDLAHRFQHNLMIPASHFRFLNLTDLVTINRDDDTNFDVLSIVNELIPFTEIIRDSPLYESTQELRDAIDKIQPRISLDEIKKALTDDKFNIGREEFLSGAGNVVLPDIAPEQPSFSRSAPVSQGPSRKKFRNADGNLIDVNPNLVTWIRSGNAQTEDTSAKARDDANLARAVKILDGVPLGDGFIRCYVIRDGMKDAIVQPEEPCCEAKNYINADTQTDERKVLTDVNIYAQSTSDAPNVMSGPSNAAENIPDVMPESSNAAENIAVTVAQESESSNVKPVVAQRQESVSDTFSSSGTPRRSNVPTPTTSVKREADDDVTFVKEVPKRRRKSTTSKKFVTEENVREMLREELSKGLNQKPASPSTTPTTPIYILPSVPQMGPMPNPPGFPYMYPPQPGASNQFGTPPQHQQFYQPPYYPPNQSLQQQFQPTPTPTTNFHPAQTPQRPIPYAGNFGAGQSAPNVLQRPPGPPGANAPQNPLPSGSALQPSQNTFPLQQANNNPLMQPGQMWPHPDPNLRYQYGVNPQTGQQRPPQQPSTSMHPSGQMPGNNQRDHTSQ